MTAARRKLLMRVGVFGLAIGLWFSPVPEGLVPPAWHLFALFVSAIASVVIGAFPILTSSVLALAGRAPGLLTLVLLPQARPADVSIRGSVVDARTAAPIADARVLIVELSQSMLTSTRCSLLTMP